VPASWDEAVWDFISALLSDSSWIEDQLVVERNKTIATTKLLETEQRKITQIQAKIARIQEGFEAGIYGTDEAKMRISGQQNAIARAEQEVKRLGQAAGNRLATTDIEALRHDLKALAERNLDEATLMERQDIINKLDIKVYRSEDLKVMRIKCGVGLTCEDKANGNGIRCGKIILDPPKGTIPRTPHRSKHLPYRVFSITSPWVS